MALLTVKDVSRREADSFPIKNASFIQQPFQHIAIAGETGSGKTTLLKMIAGLLQPTAGEILFENKKVLGPLDQLIPGHPGIGYLSQYFELRNNYRVHEIIGMSSKLADEEARRICRVCQVEHLLDRKTDQLSGGEKQRIALAGLLAASPRLLLLDEPFSNLDAIHKNTIKLVIQDISEQLGITCILVSHDAADILSWADRVLVMKDGEIIQQGTPAQVYQQPVNEYCAELFGEYNIIDSDDPAFSKIPGLAAKGRKILIRPESFTTTTNSAGALDGVVRRIFFYGSYYDIDVDTGRQWVRIRTHDKRFSPGDTVYFSVSPADVWAVPAGAGE
jgi:ABC-type sugar transport system ATPase subunit